MFESLCPDGRCTKAQRRREPIAGTLIRTRAGEHPAALLCPTASVSNLTTGTQMLAHQKLRRAQLSLRRVGYLGLLIALAWVFLGTIDGPVNFGGCAATAVYKVSNVSDWDQLRQLELDRLLFAEEPSRIHASFLLFDIKQNLRRWPNVAGDISRSPPLAI